MSSTKAAFGFGKENSANPFLEKSSEIFKGAGVGRLMVRCTKSMASLSVTALPDLLSNVLKSVPPRVIFVSLWYTPVLLAVALDLPSPLVVSSCMSSFVLLFAVGAVLNKACR